MDAPGMGKIIFLVTILVLIGILVIPISFVLCVIGLTLPTLFWFLATETQKKRKYPRIIKIVTLVEVSSTLLYMVVSLVMLPKDPFSSLGVPFIVASGFFGWINVIGGIIYIALRRQNKSNIIRGTNLAKNVGELQVMLDERHQEYLLERSYQEVLPRLSIAGVQLPAYLEDLGIFAVGSPGSGKSQAIAQLISELIQRPDFRVFCLDRNAEFVEKFYDGSKHLIFNPTDARTLNWSHKSERARPETIAAALIPHNHKEPFFSDGAKSILADLYERCDNNAEIWGALTGLSPDELKDFLKGGISHRYFISEKTGGSVLSSLVNYARFYKELPDDGQPFSFVKWAKEGDPRSLFLPLFEEDAELFKPLYSAIFELMLRGLLSNEARRIKTAIIIDELGALNALPSLARLLGESRKFGGCPVIGTQAGSQVRKIYGDEDWNTLKQTTKTKLILNCPDPQMAQMGAELIGKQERRELNSNYSGPFGKVTRSESIRETYAVLPSELQALRPMEGYLLIADGTSPAKVKLSHRSYPTVAERLVQRGARLRLVDNRDNKVS